MEGLRQDGRRAKEMRKVVLAMGKSKFLLVGINEKTMGSASCDMGCTKVIALVDGPKQLLQKEESNLGKINCSIFLTNFSTAQHKDNPKRQM